MLLFFLVLLSSVLSSTAAPSSQHNTSEVPTITTSTPHQKALERGANTSRCTGVNYDGQPLLEDKCGVCGGDGSTCRKATHSLEPFTTKTGHAEYKTVNIPKEAKHLSIVKEPSDIAHLALQTKAGRIFFQHKTNTGTSTDIEYRGSLLWYTRGTNGSELITAWGTVKASFVVAVKLTGTVRDASALPVVTVLYIKDREYNYSWKISHWSSCTRTCEGGVRMRQVVCQRHHPRRRGHAVATKDSFCEEAVGDKPNQINLCNSFGCPVSGEPPVYTWHSGNWSKCSDPCGYQTRKVICQEVLPASARAVADDSFCSSKTKPQHKIQCNSPSCPPVLGCKDEIPYCQFALKQLHLLSCDNTKHQKLCCESCQNFTPTPTLTTTSRNRGGSS